MLMWNSLFAPGLSKSLYHKSGGWRPEAWGLTLSLVLSLPDKFLIIDVVFQSDFFIQLIRM